MSNIYKYEPSEHFHIILGLKTMSDLKQYVEKRRVRDPEFAENYETGYLEFKFVLYFDKLVKRRA